jgi:hypothetical protein
MKQRHFSQAKKKKKQKEKDILGKKKEKERKNHSFINRHSNHKKVIAHVMTDHHRPLWISRNSTMVYSIKPLSSLSQQANGTIRSPPHQTNTASPNERTGRNDMSRQEE